MHMKSKNSMFTTKSHSSLRLTAALLVTLLCLVLHVTPSKATENHIIRPRPSGLGSVPLAVVNHFDAWDANFQLRQFTINEKKYLTFMVDLDLSANDVDATVLSDLIESARAETWFDYDRIYIDLLSPEGYRYGAFTIDLVGDKNHMATFDHDAWFNEPEEAPDRTGPTVDVGSMHIKLNGMDIEDKADETYLSLYLIVQNTDPEASFAPIDRLNVQLWQDQVRLTMIADFDFNKIFQLESQDTTLELEYRFKLQSESSVEIVFEDLETGEEVSRSMDLDE